MRSGSGLAINSCAEDAPVDATDSSRIARKRDSTGLRLGSTYGRGGFMTRQPWCVCCVYQPPAAAAPASATPLPSGRIALHHISFLSGHLPSPVGWKRYSTFDELPFFCLVAVFVQTVLLSWVFVLDLPFELTHAEESP